MASFLSAVVVSICCSCMWPVFSMLLSLTSFLSVIVSMTSFFSVVVVYNQFSVCWSYLWPPSKQAMFFGASLWFYVSPQATVSTARHTQHSRHNKHSSSHPTQRSQQHIYHSCHNHNKCHNCCIRHSQHIKVFAKDRYQPHQNHLMVLLKQNRKCSCVCTSTCE